MANKIAVIGGTGLYAMMEEFEQTHQEIINTPYGEPSCPLVEGRLFDQPVVFLARHGFTHRLPPHKINYLANIWMLSRVGVRYIYAVNAVGSINPSCPPKSLVLPDQLIDYTWGREHTFYGQDLEKVVHVDFTQPYSQSLRKTLLQARDNTGLTVVDNAVYGCTQGPRLETAAEIQRLKRDGCDVVGMTGMPEAVLARELSIEYASLAVVANWAAGIKHETISMAMIESNLQQGMQQVETLLTETIRISA